MHDTREIEVNFNQNWISIKIKSLFSLRDKWNET